MPSKPFYPEAELERHGLTPDDFRQPACYALSLAQPADQHDFLRDWKRVYDVDPPDELLRRAHTANGFVYVGASKRLLDRLTDHVNADVRRVTLLAVCPPTGIRDVWRMESADDAFEREYGIAMRYRNENPGLCVWCDGEIV